MTNIIDNMKKLIILSLALVITATFLGFSSINSIDTEAYAADWQRGVSFQSRGNEDFASDDFKQSVLNATTLGVDHISLVTTYYQYGRSENQMFRGWNTASDNSLREGTRFAKSLGLEVSYKLFVESNDGWRAYISPSNRAEWFRNYTDIAVNLGTLAEETGAEMIVLGTEMVGIASAAQDPANTGYWYDLIGAVRSVYSGALTYGGNWGGAFDEKNEIEFWDALDYIGVSGYYEPGRAGAYDVESIQNFWAGIDYNDLRPLSERWGKEIIFTEIGYRSVDFALERPWDYGTGGNYNPYIQEIAYEGLLSYFEGVPYIKGVHMWDYNSAPWYGGEGNTDYTPWNKPAGEVLKKYYSGNGTPALVVNPPISSDPVEEEEANTDEVVEEEEPVLPETPVNEGLLFETSVESLPTDPIIGQEVALSAEVNNMSQANAEDVIINLEIYEGDNKVHQDYVNGANVAGGEVETFEFLWTPQDAGDFSVKVGIFSGNWENLYSWFNEVEVITVAQTAIGGGGEEDELIDDLPAPEVIDSADEVEVNEDSGEVVIESGEDFDGEIEEELIEEIIESIEEGEASTVLGDIEIWWPGEGINVNGVQPFKAMLAGSDVSTYNMFWQVDGHVYNWMQNSDEEYPHKQSIVDLSTWNWKEDGTYEVTFIVQDLDGNDTHKQPVIINVR